jgi:hypothetical protein
MDTSESARIDAMQHEKGPVYELKVDGGVQQEDLKSCPDRDRRFNPAKAIRKKPEDKNIKRIENKFDNTRNNQRAVTTMKQREKNGDLA